MSETSKTKTELLAEARARKALRDKALQDERDAAELEHLLLEEKFEKETNGKLNRDFSIVDASDLGEGFIVLRLGEDVLWNTFAASKMGVVDQDAFVTPCVLHPTKDAYRLTVKRRPMVADRCSTELAHLYGLKRKEDSGK